MLEKRARKQEKFRGKSSMFFNLTVNMKNLEEDDHQK